MSEAARRKQMKTTGIHGWIDVMHVACPPDRTPTPTIPRGGGVTFGGLAPGSMRRGDAR
jgi:hypothetical protein